MWSPENAKHDERAKIRWELVPYFHGTVLDIGCQGYKAFPHFIGVDEHPTPGRPLPDVQGPCDKLTLFASQSCDTVFSAHALQRIANWKAALREWWRVVKHGGHLCLYLPHKDHSPKIGETGADIFNHYDFSPDDVITAMEELGGFDLIDNQTRTEEDEFSFFQVYKKLPSKRTLYSWQLPRPLKTAAVVRYGAFGDMIQAASILPGLKKQGYHVTLYCSDAGYDVVKHDPHIDRFVIQGKDEVPPRFLDEFWDYTEKKYNKWINLSESVECTLLAAEHRTNHGWPNELRAKYMDRNYLEWTHELAQVPPPYEPRFYSTIDERAWARKTAQQWGRKNILWSLSGSSCHKTWPWLDETIKRLLGAFLDLHIVLVGDDLCQILETGWDKERRVHCKSGVWTIRESMAFAEVADLIIGTETGLLNAAGSMETQKIVTLSHSSQEMLTKHWKNTVVLEQPKDTGCPKQPCRMLHYNWDHCMKHESGTAVCQATITADMMWDAIRTVFGSERKVA